MAGKELPQGFRSFVMGANFLPVPLGGRLAATEVMVRRWPKGRPPYLEPVTGGTPSVELRKKLQVAFKLLESIRFGGGNLSRELCDGSLASSVIPAKAGIQLSRHANLSFFCSYKDKLGYLPPWLADDGDPATEDDSALRKQIDTVVMEKEVLLKDEGLEPGTKRYNERMLDELLLAGRSLKGKSGVPIVYTRKQQYHGRDGVDAFRGGAGACFSFAFNLAAMLGRAWIPFEFIRISGRRPSTGGAFEEDLHIGIAVRLDPANRSRLTLVDPSLGVRPSEDSIKWYPVTRLEMLAYHFKNVALLSSNETLLRQAITLAPDNFEILLGARWFHRYVTQDPAREELYLIRARTVNPSLSTMY